MAKITYTTATLSAEVDTTPKELRKFLRSDASGIEKVGKGGRYSLDFTATQLKSLKKNFAAWVADADAKKVAKVAAEVEVTELDEDALIAADADDPTPEDLDDITGDPEDFDDLEV